MRTDRRVLLAGGTIVASVSIAQALKGIGMPISAPEKATVGAVSVRDFGAIGDGRADDRVAVQRAYEKVAAQGGGHLYFPSGQYRIALTLTSRAVHLCGAGASSSILAPATPNAAAVTALYRNGGIAPVSINDLGFRGSERSGVLFSAGGERYVKDAEYSGGNHFARCSFDGAARCIERRFGSIDLQIDQCQFDNADYHIHITTPDERDGADVMHGGCLIIRRCWFRGFEKAMLFVDSPVVGSGQITLEQNVVENGRGFVHYFRKFYGSRAPAIVVRDQWNEATATGNNLTIDEDRRAHAKFIYAEEVTPTIIVENTPAGSVDLHKASLVTRDCDLSDFALEADSMSSVVHYGATALAGTIAGRTRSIAAPIQQDPLRMPWFRTALPSARSLAFALQTLFADDCAPPFSLTGSRMEAGKPILNDAALPSVAACTEIGLHSGDRLFPAVSRQIPANHWLVALLIYRMVSGEAMAQVTGTRGISGVAQLTSETWEALVGICRPSEAGISGNSLHFTCADTAVLRLGGIALVATPTLGESLDFANALMFPTTLR